MKFSTTVILTLLASGLPLNAQATCFAYPNFSYGVSFQPTITVPTSLAVGGLIASQSFGGSYPQLDIKCLTATQRVVTGKFGSLASLPGLTGVYHTGVPGIGMRVQASNGSAPTSDVTLTNRTHTMPAGLWRWQVTNLRAEFYKTGTVSDGTLTSGHLHDERWAGTRGRVQMLLNNSIRFVNPAATCDLATGDVNRTIALPTIKASDLKDALYAGAQNFELTANCSNASNVVFRFTGTPAAGNSSLFANTGSAGGVALLLYSRINGMTQTISPNALRTVAVSGNRAVLPLGAAYYKNGTVGAGSLASTATVNITYN